MGLDGVGGDEAALDGQDRQHFQRRLQFVGLGIDPHLGHDGFDIRGVSGQEMDCGGLAVAAAAKGLAVDRQVGRVARLEPAADPAGDGRLEGGDIDAAEDAGVSGLAQPAATGEAEELEELPAAFLAVIDDRLVCGHARKHGDDGQGEQGRQGVSLTPGGARIRKALKQFHQGDVGFHAQTLI